MQLSINLVCNQKPRLRPEFPEEAQVFRPPLTADFQEDIRIGFIKALHQKGKQKLFPVTEPSLIMIVHSNQKLNLVGVTKNVMDALRGLAFTDDVEVSSLLIRQRPGPVDITSIVILTGKQVSTDEDEMLRHYTMLSFDVEGQVSDRVIPVPTIGLTGKVSNEATQNGTLIKELVSNQYDGPPLEVELELSFEICTKSLRTDIDNIVLEYMVNLDGLVFKEFHQVKLLNAVMAKDNSKADQCILTVRFRNE